MTKKPTCYQSVSRAMTRVDFMQLKNIKQVFFCVVEEIGATVKRSSEETANLKLPDYDITEMRDSQWLVMYYYRLYILHVYCIGLVMSSCFTSSLANRNSTVESYNTLTRLVCTS